MFSTVAEELFSGDLPVADSAFAVFGKRQNNNAIQPFSCELQSQ